MVVNSYKTKVGDSAGPVYPSFGGDTIWKQVVAKPIVTYNEELATSPMGRGSHWVAHWLYHK